MSTTSTSGGRVTTADGMEYTVPGAIGTFKNVVMWRRSFADKWEELAVFERTPADAAREEAVRKVIEKARRVHFVFSGTRHENELCVREMFDAVRALDALPTPPGEQAAKGEGTGMPPDGTRWVFGSREVYRVVNGAIYFVFGSGELASKSDDDGTWLKTLRNPTKGYIEVPPPPAPETADRWGLGSIENGTICTHNGTGLVIYRRGGQPQFSDNDLAKIVDAVNSTATLRTEVERLRAELRRLHDGGDEPALTYEEMKGELHSALGTIIEKDEQIAALESRLAERGAEGVENDGTGEQTMVKVDGKTFRCDCGGNVFTVIGRLRYRCNSCRATWTGEADATLAEGGAANG